MNYVASNNQPVFAEGAAQIMGVEAEHRALGRVASATNPPNNLILEDALCKQVRAATTPSIVSAISNPGLA